MKEPHCVSFLPRSGRKRTVEGPILHRKWNCTAKKWWTCLPAARRNRRSYWQNATLRTLDITFDTEAKIDLGGVMARLLWFGGAHTKGDELTFVEPDRTLISGDVVQNKVMPNIFGDGGTPSSWLIVLDKAAALNALHVLRRRVDGLRLRRGSSVICGTALWNSRKRACRRMMPPNNSRVSSTRSTRTGRT